MLVGYYAQSHEGLDTAMTVLATVLAARPMTEEAARTFLGRFLFEEDDVFKQVGVLSGGERSRLALAVLTLQRANFLILDEPTNHLDIIAREALEDVLDEYDGTILFVSHDRAFVDALATQVWMIEESDGRRRPARSSSPISATTPICAGRRSGSAPPPRSALPAKNGATPRKTAPAERRQAAAMTPAPDAADTAAPGGRAYAPHAPETAGAGGGTRRCAWSRN